VDCGTPGTSTRAAHYGLVANRRVALRRGIRECDPGLRLTNGLGFP